MRRKMTPVQQALWTMYGAMTAKLGPYEFAWMYIAGEPDMDGERFAMMMDWLYRVEQICIRPMKDRDVMLLALELAERIGV